VATRTGTSATSGGGVYFNGTSFTTGAHGSIGGNIAPANGGKAVWNAATSPITIGGVTINNGTGEDGDIIW
jgi:hypothetical protein